ncbi:MAG: KpsF/GutQ family sugar-phosphate isomerase [Opitutales bacterium]
MGTRDLETSAKESIQRVINGLLSAQNALGEEFERAVACVLKTPGKLIVCGVGKSGLIGQKLAATFSSTGTPAVFLHAVEALHGDLGLVAEGDAALLISNSGSTELVRLVPFLKQRNLPIISILGKSDSPLGEVSDVILKAGIEQECDDHDIVPSVSTSVALALGDALAVALMQARSFSPNEFAKHHPAGQLGRNLSMRVEDVMQPLDHLSIITESTPMRSVVIGLTDRPQGAALVLSDKNQLIGLVTDGDVRRALQKVDDVFGLCAKDIMTADPIRVDSKEILLNAIALMENRERQISVLPVVHEDKCVGLLRLHDVYRH